MLKIRREQQEVFRQQTLADFEERGIQHLRRDLPEPTSPFSDGDLRQRIRECIPRAAAYGLKTERETMCFVDVTYLLGREFDTNPQHAWSQEVLTSTKLGTTDKAHLLLATACSLYQEARGNG